MTSPLEKRPDEIAQMDNQQFGQWLEQVHSDMEEASDRKGFIRYVVNDAMNAGGDVGERLNQAYEEYQSYRSASAEAEAAEARAAQAEARLAQRRAQLGQS